MRSRVLSLPFAACLLVLAGCAGGSPSAPPTSPSTPAAPAPASNPAPALSTITPASAPAGSQAFTLTLTGTGFVQGSAVQWNGAALATTYTSATSLSAQVPASDLQAAGTAQVTVETPAPGGGTSSAQTFTIVAPNAAPALTGIHPASAPAGSPALTLTLTGSAFTQASSAQWNGAALPTSFVSANTLTAQVPASDLTASGNFQVTVSTPAPGGGTSAAQTFTVLAAGNGTPISLNIEANSLAWDPASQRLYLSLPSTAGANGNSVQALDPMTGNLGASGFAGSEPNLLSVSANGKYIYVGLGGASSVERLALPGLTQDISIPLGNGKFYGPYYAGAVEASPVADETVAVVRVVRSVSPAEEGGVLLYDNAAQRPNKLCGFIEQGCTGKPDGGLYDKIQWNADGTEIFAANTEDTGFDFYKIPVTAAGFGTVTDYPGVVQRFFSDIHFDAASGYLFTDDGGEVDPQTGTLLGTFHARGVMAVDGKLGLAYFVDTLTDVTGSGSYTLFSFDLKHFTPVATFSLSNVTGIPTHLVRWGTNGLALTTGSTLSGGNTIPGQVYILSGSFVTGTAP